MNFRNWRSIVIAAVATSCLSIPAIGSAQYNRHPDRGGDYSRNDLRDTVDYVERESNSFRDFFEHHFKSNGHQERYGPDRGDNGHPEHQGRHGEMTLRDAIQNLDEEMERIRKEVDNHGRTREARDLMAEAIDHMRDVDVRINRVSDSYYFNGNRSWRYERSELANKWHDLRSDLLDLERDFNRRR